MKLDRTNEVHARRVMELVYPDESLRRVALGMLADSIRMAHAAGPAAWELTLKRQGFTLNIGMIFLLGIEIGGVFIGRDEPDPFSKEFSMMVAGEVFSPRVQQSLSDVISVAPSSMVAVPFLLDITMPRNDVARLRRHAAYDRLFAAHRAAAISGARRRPTSIWWRSHSTGLTEYLREFLDQEVPDPLYAERAAAFTLV